MEKNCNEKQEQTHVRIKIQRDGQKDVPLMIKRSVPLGKVMRAYCNNLELDRETVRFTIDGKRIKDLQTADDLGLQDGSVLDAWSDQHGGGSIYYSFYLCTPPS